MGEDVRPGEGTTWPLWTITVKCGTGEVPASLLLAVLDLLTPGRGTDEDRASHGDGDTVLSTGNRALCRTG